jgi:hypothetical protein
VRDWIRRSQFFEEVFFDLDIDVLQFSAESYVPEPITSLDRYFGHSLVPEPIK